MIYTIQDEERAMRVHMEALEREAIEKGLEQGREQGLEQGIEQGIEQGRFKTLAELVCDGVLSTASAAERAGMTTEQFTNRASCDGIILE